MRPQDLGIGMLFETIRDAVIVADASTGRIVLWNPAATEIFGYSPEEALDGLNVESLVPEHHKERHRAGLSHYHDTGHGPYIDSYDVLDLPAVRKGGEEIRIELTLSPVDPLPEAVAEGRRFVLAVVRDATKRKRAEEENSRQVRHAALRADVSAALGEGGALRSVLQRCAECMVRHLDATFARIWTLNEEENVLELRASAGTYTHLDGPHGRVPAGEFKIGRIAQERMPLLTNDVLNDPRISDKEWAEREGMRAFAGYPLIVEGRIAGVVAMFAWHPLEEDTIEALASVADVIAQGIRRKEVEEALRESEEFFRALYEDVRHPIFLLDKDLKFVDANPHACEFYGYGREEFRGMKVSDIVAPEELIGHREAADTLLREDEVLIAERRQRKKSGEVVTVAVDVDRVVRSGEELYVAKITDVTERKQAEDEIRKLNEQLEDRVAERTSRLEAALEELRERERGLRESKERYQAVVEQAGEGIFLFDPRTKRVLETNPAFRRMFGYDEGELRRITLYDLVPQDPEGVDRNVERAIKQGQIWIGERVYRRKDGSRIDVEVSGNVLSYGGEEVICSVVRDATERKRAEEALRASEARFRTLVEQSPFSIQIFSPDGRTLRVNRAWEELFGTTLDEIEGYNVLEDPQLAAKGVMLYILKGFAGEPTVIPPIAYVPDETISGISEHGGRALWTQGFIYPVKDEAGNVREVVLMHEDVSERKRAEEALQKVREAERNRMARDLHDGALQDLTYALAEAQILKILSESSNLRDRLEGQIEALKRSARGLREAVYGLLQTGAEDRPWPERLGSLVEESRRMSPDCHIRLEVGEGFPPALLDEGATELLRIVQEALTNARKHSGAENVRVELKAEGDDLVAKVEDDGQGFEPDTISAGVGLRSMRERAAALGGKLEVESESGRGTRVRLRTPLRKAGGGGRG